MNLVKKLLSMGLAFVPTSVWAHPDIFEGGSSYSSGGSWGGEHRRPSPSRPAQQVRVAPQPVAAAPHQQDQALLAELAQLRRQMAQLAAENQRLTNELAYGQPPVLDANSGASAPNASLVQSRD